jgi:CHAT domain-containing protein
MCRASFSSRNVMKRFAKRLLQFILIIISVCLILAVALPFVLRPPASPDAALERADKMAWLNNWIGAEPLYGDAEHLFTQRHETSKALYARVSQMPARMESRSLPAQIWSLTQYLALPEAQDPQTRLRILLVKGMIETNYDGATARSTWQMVEHLAQQQHQYLLATRAGGEQGIAAFLLGDIASARAKVRNAYVVAKYAGDYAAQIRYASVYGAGLVELHKYSESFGPLDEAIRLAKDRPGMPYPSIAVTAKIEALSGNDRHREALALTNEAVQYARAHGLVGHLYQILETRADVYERMNRWRDAIADYSEALRCAREISYWRGVAEVGGPLAKEYERQGDVKQALNTIDEAIQANTRIPNELYFAPRNMAMKAEITAKMGQTAASNALYQKSADLIDSLLADAPTPNVERSLLEELSNVYSGYFISLCNQRQYSKAFRVIEKARGRIEAQSLQHHSVVQPHPPTAAEIRLNELDVELLNTDDKKKRSNLSDAIYDVEQQLNMSSLEGQTATNPVDLKLLQEQLHPSELFMEYVLAGSHSYALAITRQTVKEYELSGRGKLESLSEQYRNAIDHQKTDQTLAQRLFNELLGRIPEYTKYATVIIVPDGSLHLLPFSALMNQGQYLIASHTITTAPSGTVFALLRGRNHEAAHANLPYVGVAAWTKTANATNFPVRHYPRVRAIAGPERSLLSPLPQSEHEVESIAENFPKPSKLLLGSNATETHFKQLPLGDYNVLHLALHGFVDLDYPDRSALVFAPQTDKIDDGLLQIREIRHLRLNANLVTLSACNTGVGPVGEEGVDNLVNAFIQAGAQSVVSTLWETDDRATIQLMANFYARLAHEEAKSTSLREAELDLINSGLPPYYWAPFELVGDPSGTLPARAPATLSLN